MCLWWVSLIIISAVTKGKLTKLAIFEDCNKLVANWSKSLAPPLVRACRYLRECRRGRSHRTGPQCCCWRRSYRRSRWPPGRRAPGRRGSCRGRTWGKAGHRQSASLNLSTSCASKKQYWNAATVSKVPSRGQIIFAHLRSCVILTPPDRSVWEVVPGLQQCLQWSQAVLQLTRDGSQQGRARCAAACEVLLLHIVEQHKVPEDRSWVEAGEERKNWGWSSFYWKQNESSRAPVRNIYVCEGSQFGYVPPVAAAGK